MAIGWAAALKLIPWSEVISNAPMVADGAKRLWSTVAKKPASSQADTEVSAPASALESQIDIRTNARLVVLEAAIADLHAQMVASSGLIQALADQNTQLIARVEANRARVRRLVIGGWLFAVAAVGCIVFLSFNRVS